MNRKYKHQNDQLIQRRESLCEVRMDADRITLTLEKVYPKAMARVAEEMESMRLCAYTIIEGGKLYLMQPDFGMFGGDEEFLCIVKELFNEENYEIIYKE